MAINISTRWFGDNERADSRSRSVVESYSGEIYKIREGLGSSLTTLDPDLQAVVNPALHALDAIAEGNVSGASDLLPFIEWLNRNQGHSVSGLLGGTGVQGTLNYVLDGIFGAKLRGVANSMDNREMGTMLRFYAGNPSQTSEGSWKTNNIMLYVFGDRLVDYLASQAPDRIAPFYKAVQDARRSALRGPDPDEEAIPDDEQPTAEQLRGYEAALGRLEALATTGVLPKPAPPEPKGKPGQPASPLVSPSHQPQAPREAVEAKTAPTPSVA